MDVLLKRYQAILTLIVCCLCVSNGAFVTKFRGKWPYAAFKWQPKDDIFYRLDTSLLKNETRVIQRALNFVQRHTCLRFRMKQDLIVGGIIFSRINEENCRSNIGRQTLRNYITGNWRCFRKIGKIMHEIMHTLGFLHEHQRPDRDEHVKILWNNLQNRVSGNYETLKYGAEETYDTPYDLLSVMHYGIWKFSRLNGAPTMEILDKNVLPYEVGQRDGFSKGDIRAINKVYCS